MGIEMQTSRYHRTAFSMADSATMTTLVPANDLSSKPRPAWCMSRDMGPGSDMESEQSAAVYIYESYMYESYRRK